MIRYSISVRSAQPGTKKSEVTSTKAYAVAQTSEVMNQEDFCRHIAEHGSVYGRADIQSVTTQIVDCLREQLLEGKKVQLGDLGSFHISLQSTGAADAAQFTAQHIKKVKVVWTPGKSFVNLRSGATFELVASRTGQQNAISDEKQTPVQKPELS